MFAPWTMMHALAGSHPSCRAARCSHPPRPSQVCAYSCRTRFVQSPGEEGIEGADGGRSWGGVWLGTWRSARSSLPRADAAGSVSLRPCRAAATAWSAATDGRPQPESSPAPSVACLLAAHRPRRCSPSGPSGRRPLAPRGPAAWWCSSARRTSPESVFGSSSFGHHASVCAAMARRPCAAATRSGHSLSAGLKPAAWAPSHTCTHYF